MGCDKRASDVGLAALLFAFAGRRRMGCDGGRRGDDGLAAMVVAEDRLAPLKIFEITRMDMGGYQVCRQ